MNTSDEGQEVYFGGGQSSFTTGRDSVDVNGLKRYMTSIGEALPVLAQQHMVLQNAEDPLLAVMKSKGIKTGTTVFPGYVFGTCLIVSEIGLGTLHFDNKMEVNDTISHIVEMLGVCPAIILWPIKDYGEWKEDEKRPYTGRMKFITFDELLF